MNADLVLAAHVGSYVAATHVADGALVAIALAAGLRGEHRVCVFDTDSWQRVAAFTIPASARSGVTPLAADGKVLFANDDHSVSAFEARTGRLLWARSFPAPLSVRLHDARGGRILVSVTGERQGRRSRSPSTPNIWRLHFIQCGVDRTSSTTRDRTFGRYATGVESRMPNRLR